MRRLRCRPMSRMSIRAGTLTSKRARIAVAAAALVAVGGGATAVAATTGGPAKADSAPARFDAALAQQLGIDQAKLDAARKAAATKTIDDLLAAGQIDQDRATKLKEAVAAGRVPFGGPGGRGPGGPGLGPGGPGGRGGAPFALLAAALGQQPADVAKALRDGTTPADLIAKAGKQVDAVKADITKAARTELQGAVDAGRLTAAQADTRAGEIATRLTADEAVGPRGGHGGPGRPGGFGGFGPRG